MKGAALKKSRLRSPLTSIVNKITTAIIEIDHINFGLNKKTKALNTRKRTNFSLPDIEKFLMLLDGEQVFARNHKGRVSQLR